MKKILIVNNNMHLGGVQRALVSLLWSVCDRYDVTLLLFYPVGESMKDLPPNVRVISPKSPYRCFGITKNDACGAWDRLCRSFYAAITRLVGRKYAVALMSPWQRKLKDYDVAVSYLHDAGERVFYGGCNDFVLRHVEAERKITFLHCDYRRCGANTEENRKKYAKFDAIAACSRGCADSFTAAVPELKDKVHVVRNCHRFDLIRDLSSQESLQKRHCEERSDVAICTTASESLDNVGFDAHIEPTANRKNEKPRFDVGIEPYESGAMRNVEDAVPYEGEKRSADCTVGRLARNEADGTMWASSPTGVKTEGADSYVAPLLGMTENGNADSYAALRMTPPQCAAKWDVEDAVPYGSENRSADSHASLEMTKIRILTVARLGKEKGVERALHAITALGEAKQNLRYDVIGDGIQRPLLEKIIEDERLSDCARLLGAMDNPYAHIRAADLLLIPSYNEAAPLVIGEAACLGTPILSTETSSAREMIEQTGFGWVCENSEDGLTHALASLLAEPEKLRLVAKELQERIFDNKTALEQFDFLLQCKS